MILYKDDITTYGLEDFNNVNWQQVPNTPRKEAFFADVENMEYSYDGQEFVYKSQIWLAQLRHIKDTLNEQFGTNYNVCFMNRYENEKNHLGWHSDDSTGMNLNHPIAVISFGAERYIYWKLIGKKGEVKPFQKVLLKNKSLFVMPAHFQRFFAHKIPKHDRSCGPRISLTFRNFQK